MNQIVGLSEIGIRFVLNIPPSGLLIGRKRGLGSTHKEFYISHL